MTHNRIFCSKRTSSGRNGNRIGKAVLYLMVLQLFVVSGCSTSLLERGPRWLSETPAGGQGMLYVVGGPAVSLEEAKALTYKEISQFVSTSVQAVMSSYTAISADDLSLAVKEQFSRSIETGTDTVLVGIEFAERWQDPKTGSWFVLASITDASLKEGIEKTAEMLAEKKKAMAAAAADIEKILLPLHDSSSQLTIREMLSLLSKAQQVLDSSGFGEDLMAKPEGAQTLIQPYLENKYREVFGSLNVELRLEDEVLYQGTSVGFSLQVSARDGRSPGDLPWVLKAERYQLKPIITHEGAGSGALSVNLLDITANTITVTLDNEALGLALPDEFDRSTIPRIEQPIAVRAGKLNFVFIHDDEADLKLAENELRDLYRRHLPFTFTETGEAPYTLILGLQREPGTENTYGIVFTHLSVTCSLFRGDRQLFFFTSPMVKGSGLDERQSLRKALEGVIAVLDETPELFEQIAELYN